MASPSNRHAGAARAAMLGAAAALCGCAADATSARLVELEVAVARIERRLDELSGLRERLDLLEAARALPPAAEPASEARLADLELRVRALEERARAPLVDPAPPASELEPAARAGSPLVTIPGGPARGTPAGGAAPTARDALEVVSVGSGALLLVRTPAGLERLELLGVDAPLRPEEYAEDPELRARHAAALGEGATRDEAAFERSFEHLRALIGQGAAVRVRYAEGGPTRSPAGALVGYLVVERGGEQVDVNAAMIRDGYALADAARGRHEQAARYQELELEARRERRGLFGP